MPTCHLAGPGCPKRDLEMFWDRLGKEGVDFEDQVRGIRMYLRRLDMAEGLQSSKLQEVTETYACWMARGSCTEAADS